MLFILRYDKPKISVRVGIYPVVLAKYSLVRPFLVGIPSIFAIQSFSHHIHKYKYTPSHPAVNAFCG